MTHAKYGWHHPLGQYPRLRKRRQHLTPSASWLPLQCDYVTTPPQAFPTVRSYTPKQLLSQVAHVRCLVTATRKAADVRHGLLPKFPAFNPVRVGTALVWDLKAPFGVRTGCWGFGAI